MWKLASSLLLAAGAANAQATVQPEAAPSGVPFPDSYYPKNAMPYALAGAKSFQTSTSSFPSPWMDGSGGWADAYTKAQALVAQMTLAEKVNVTSGVGWEGERCVGQTGGAPRVGFRSMCMQDSPVGLRDSDYNSVFPAGGTIAATWDRSLFYLRGYDMGSEHRDKGVDVQLGPVCGPLGRSPEGGRNWEGFSPDPYLTGIAVAQTVQGMQAAGVIACTKHFIGNEQEHFRQTGEAQGYGYNITQALSSNIDDRTLHELYMWPFADAVRAGTGAVMCSYNQINNTYACENSYLMNHLLKGELGFQGFVMSDWQAQKSGVHSSLSGMDMAMPGDTLFNTGEGFWGTNLTIAVLNGTMPEWRVTDMATRIVAAWYLVGRDKTQVPINFDSWTLDTFGNRNFYAQKNYQVINEHVDVRQSHGQDIRNMASRATVLLKNTDGALPLDHSAKFTAVFGDDAGGNLYGPNGCSDRGCDNGTLGMAWGSGSSNFANLITPAQAIQNEIQSNGNGVVQVLTDNYAYNVIPTLAGQATVSMVFVNADSGEGFINVDGNEGDRNNLTLWRGANELIQNVTSACNNTIVVIHSTGPVLLTDWYDNDNVTAILWAGVPGEQTGNSIADVLYGRVNPGAKLPFTLGAARADYGTDLLYNPNNGENAPQDNFGEGVFIDYRAFDKFNVTPIYEFGYGLSYTTFALSDMSVESHQVGAYAPTNRMTAAAPASNTAGNASDYVFPTDAERVPYYIYPWLNSTNLRASSGDPDYGSSDFVSADATDGSPQAVNPAGGAPGGNPELYDVLFTVRATVTNTGKVDGDEVPQLYISLGGPEDPKVQLRGFDRLSVPAGQSATFSTDVTRRDLSNWDIVSQNWVISSWPKTAYVGSSSRNLPLSMALDMTAPFSTSSSVPSYGPGTLMPVSSISDHQVQAPSSVSAAVTSISDHQIQAPSSVPAAVTSISDHQIQAPSSVPAAVTSISDHQIQAPSSAPAAYTK